MIEKRDVDRLIKAIELLEELTRQVSRVAYALEGRYQQKCAPCTRCGCTLLKETMEHCPCCHQPLET